MCAAGAEAAAFALAAAGVSEPWRASALGAAGLLFVVAARRGWPPLAGHVGLVGHSASLIAIGAAVAAAGVHGGHVSAALVLATAGFAVTAVRQEREGAPAVATAAQAVAFDPGTAARIGVLPAFMALIGLPVAVVGLLDNGLASDRFPAVAGVALGVIGFAYGTSTRLLRRRATVARLAADVGLVTAVTGARLAFQEPWASLVTLVAVGLTVVALAPPQRRPVALWVGWIAFSAATVRAAALAGVRPERLHLVLFVWGAAVLVGALAWDRLRFGRREEAGWVRDRCLEAPAMLAALALPVGLLPVYASTETLWSWWSITGATVVVAVALLTRLAPLSGIAWVLTSVAAAGIVPFDPLDEPMAFVAWGAVLVAIAAVLGWRVPSPTILQRWDLPAEFVGLAAVAIGVGLAPAAGQVPEAWLAAGVLLLLVAGWHRSPVFASAGVFLVNGAALAAGPGWSALALAATSVATTAAAIRAAGLARTCLQACSIVVAALAWVQFGTWAGWGGTTWAVATALAGGALAFAVALAAPPRPAQLVVDGRLGDARRGRCRQLGAAGPRRRSPTFDRWACGRGRCRAARRCRRARGSATRHNGVAAHCGAARPRRRRGGLVRDRGVTRRGRARCDAHMLWRTCWRAGAERSHTAVAMDSPAGGRRLAAPRRGHRGGRPAVA